MDKAFWRQLFLFLHVLGAIVALGFSLTYGLWTARGDREGGERRVFALRTVSWIDGRLTTPAYVMQAVTGVILILLIGTELLELAWLELGIGLYVLLTVIAMSRYTPLFRRQIALAERLAAGEQVEADYETAASTARTWGLVVTAITVVIVFLMVWKPAL